MYVGYRVRNTRLMRKLFSFKPLHLVALFAVVLPAGGMTVDRDLNSEQTVRMRVTADHVNLRSGPGAQSDIVSQVSKGDILLAQKYLDAEWVQIVPPSDVNLWVYGELVRGGVVAVARVLVRAGPGINYRSVGRLEKGEKVDARGIKGDWIKIAPPAGTVLWISGKYIEPAARRTKRAEKKPDRLVRRPPKPEHVRVRRVAASTAYKKPDRMVRKPPKPEHIPARPVVLSTVNRERKLRSVVLPPAGSSGTPGKPVRKPSKPAPKGLVAVEHKHRGKTGSSPLPPGLAGRELLSSRQQGRQVQYLGVLRPSALVWRRPSKYRLVRSRNEKSPAVTVCYVLGNEDQLASLVGRTLVIHGLEYWVQAVRHSVVVPEKIIKKN